MTAKIFTVERTTTEKLDYKFDLAEVTNGRDGAVADVLESGEEIASYTLISSDVDLVVSDDALTDSNTSIQFFVSGGDLADVAYYVDAHIITNSTPVAREYDFSMRFILVQRK